MNVHLLMCIPVCVRLICYKSLYTYEGVSPYSPVIFLSGRVSHFRVGWLAGWRLEECRIYNSDAISATYRSENAVQTLHRPP